ncbi:hypothetical protein HOD19_02715, partial [bacterium]|nr:hypothetical protein [bacterium]
LVCGQSACVLNDGSLEVVLGKTCSTATDFCTYKQAEEYIPGGCNSVSGFCYIICPDRLSDMGLGNNGVCSCVTEAEVIANQPLPTP